MDKLTREYLRHDGVMFYDHADTDEPIKGEYDCLQKLGKLEAYEEKIGMPLDVFLHILIDNEPIYVADYDGVEEIDIDCVVCNQCSDGVDVRFNNTDRGGCSVSTTLYDKDFFLDEEQAGNRFLDKVDYILEHCEVDDNAN